MVFESNFKVFGSDDCVVRGVGQWVGGAAGGAAESCCVKAAAWRRTGGYGGDWCATDRSC